MTKQKLPPEFLKRLAAVTKKRAKTVIDHILKHGFITTDDLTTLYGYGHPPRAIGDVRDEGIPLERYSVKSPTSGRTIAAYKFGDPSKIRNDRIGGRVAFAKQFKTELVERYGERCAICFAKYEERYLQVDHRIPYMVAGDESDTDRNVEDYMLLCGSCNRAKSWSCENCRNGIEIKSPEICKACYWAHPESYEHIAMRNVRRIDVEWSGDETEVYDRLHKIAESSDVPMPDYVKAALKKHLDD